MSANDAMLVAAKAGCGESISQLLVLSSRYVSSIVRQQLNAKMQRRLGVEDLTQDVCYRVVRDLQQCRADTWTAFLGWLGRVTVNHIIRTIEGVNTKKRSGEVRRIDAEFDVLDRRPGPYAIVEARETYADVMSLAAAKGDRTKQVVEMLSGGYKTEDIASTMRDTKHAVSAVMKRFRGCANQSVQFSG